MFYYSIDLESFYKIEKILKHLDYSYKNLCKLNSYRWYLNLSYNDTNTLKKNDSHELSPVKAWEIIVNTYTTTHLYSHYVYFSINDQFSSLERFLESEAVPSAVKQKLIFNLDLFSEIAK